MRLIRSVSLRAGVAFRNWSHARFPVLVFSRVLQLDCRIEFFPAAGRSTISGTRSWIAPSEFCHLAYQPGAQVGVLFRRHHKDRFQVGLQLAVHHRHLQLIFIIAERTNSAQHGAGFDPGRVIHGQAIENVDLNVL